MIEFEKGGVSCEATCEYNWKDADDTQATGSLYVREEDDDGNEITDEAALKLLTDGEFASKLAKEFGNKYVGFEARSINGKRVSSQSSLAQAIADHLRAHPGERLFELEGVIG